MPTVAEERLNIRLDADKKEAIEKAASLQGLSLTDFATLVLYREAQEVLRQDQTLVLSDRDRDSFLDALDNPPHPNARALRAAAKYREAKATGKLK